MEKKTGKLFFVFLSYLKRISATNRNRSQNTSLYEHIAGFPHQSISLGTRNSSSQARTSLIYYIFNSSINLSGVSSFGCFWYLLMQHEEIFLKHSFILKALTTQPETKADFVVHLQIEKSNGTKPHCIFPQLGFINSNIKKCLFVHLDTSLFK